jgi:hypothetical protein
MKNLKTSRICNTLLVLLRLFLLTLFKNLIQKPLNLLQSGNEAAFILPLSQYYIEPQQSFFSA